MSAPLSFVGPIPVRTHAPVGPSRGAVILMHGLRVSGEAHAREARWLAEGGMTVVCPDAPHHGARRSPVLDAMPDALTLPGHRVLLRILREARDELPALVDHLLAAGHRRVAIAGISMGAFVALAAAAVTPRACAIASVLGTPDWTPRDGVVPDDLSDAVRESPHLHPEAFPPRPLLLLNGGRDDNVRPAAARALAERLRPLYAASGGGPFLHREYPDADHFPSDADWRDMWTTAVAFLQDALAG